jgi:GAF domain-containing protein
MVDGTLESNIVRCPANRRNTMNKTARRQRFSRITRQIEELISATDDPVAHRATAAAILHHKVTGVSWTGFYMVRHHDLVVDAYQGPVACLVLERHTGVCWAGIDRGETVLVPDVHTFPGHIPCDDRSRSEIVVPLFDKEGNTIGVLDADSHHPDHFDEVDREGYESVVRLLERRWYGEGHGR